MRTKLIAFSMVLLALPWLGWRYLDGIHDALLQGREETQWLAAQALAASFARAPVLLDEVVVGASASLDDDKALIYAAPLPEAPLLDGYAGDWTRAWGRSQATGEAALASHPRQSSATATGNAALRWYAGSFGEQLYLLAQVDDRQRVWRHPGVVRLDSSDQLRLLVEDVDGQRWRLALTAEGPGAVSVEAMAPGWRFPLYQAPSLPIDGQWQESAEGYQLELRMPLAWLKRVAVAALDVDDPLSRRVEDQHWSVAGPSADALNKQPPIGEQVARPVEPGDAAAVGEAPRLFQLIAPDAGLQALLDGMPTSLGRVTVVDRRRWVRASSQGGGLGGNAPQPARVGVERLQAALNGVPQRSVQRGQYGAADTIVVVQPILAHDSAASSVPEVIGAVLVEQPLAELMSLQWRAFVRLTLETVGVLLLVVVGLLLFASRIAWRLRRLGSEAATAIDSDGRVQHATIQAEARASDELGGLSRQISAVLGRLQRFTGFIEGVPRTLRHELNNPLNVISTSLQNLADTRPVLAKDRYLLAAGRGVARMERIVHSLTEAAGLEQSMRGDEFRRFDLAALLNDYVASVADTLPPGKLVYRGAARGVDIVGSDLRIEQLLDKLIDNAVDFTPVEGRIEVSLECGEGRHWLRVSNDGPPLPASIGGERFDSMVSKREQGGAADDRHRVHLGIGLYMASTIAERHGGILSAANRPDGGGAVFSVGLPSVG